MSLELEPLRKLARKIQEWRTRGTVWMGSELEGHLGTTAMAVAEQCATDVEFLIPAIEKRIAELKESLKVHVLTGDQLADELTEKEARIAALKTLGPCGIHPGACWQPIRPSIQSLTTRMEYHCVACVQQEKAVQLERATALQQVCDHVLVEEMPWTAKPKDPNPNKVPARRHITIFGFALKGKNQRTGAKVLLRAQRLREAILAPLSPSDRSALDAFKAEVRYQALEEAILSECEMCRSPKYWKPQIEGYHQRIGDWVSRTLCDGNRIRALQGSKP